VSMSPRGQVNLSAIRSFLRLAPHHFLPTRVRPIPLPCLMHPTHQRTRLRPQLLDDVHLLAQDRVDQSADIDFALAGALRIEHFKGAVEVDRDLQLFGLAIEFSLLSLGEIVFLFHGALLAR